MKKVLLRYYDKKNLGDDLFIKVVSERYLNNFTLVSKSLPFKSNNINISLWGNNFTILFYRILGKLKSRAAYNLSVAAKKHDLLLYVGGSLFIDNRNTSQWERERKFYHSLKIPYYILGSNVGPVYDNQFLITVKDIFKEAADVCVRDQVSFELVKDIPSVRVSTDIVFTMKVDTKISEKLVVFSIINGDERFSNEVTDGYEKKMAELTSKFIEEGYKVVYMSFCREEGDEIAIDRIFQTLTDDQKSKVTTYNYSGDLEEALLILSKSEYIIASRFHAVILGLLYGKKVLPVIYSEKTSNILKDMNFQGPIVKIENVEKFNTQAFDIRSIEGHDISEQKIISEKQFYMLDKLLERKAKDV